MKAYVNGVLTEIERPKTETDPIHEIQIRKQQLDDTDYIDCKIIEGAATVEEYADIIAQRQKWRDEINAFESELKNRGL